MQQTSSITCPYCSASNLANAGVCVTCGSRIVALPKSQAEHKDGLPAGTILGNGRFQIVNEIARGGFGITYLAFDNQAKNYAAIKECFPEGLVTRGSGLKVVPNLGAELEFQAALIQFHVEANILKKLEHQSATHLIDTAKTNNTSYLFMEYLIGKTLEQRIEEGTLLSEKECREMLKPILELLQELHGNGWLHRDIKPANIILTKDRVELLDFGSAIRHQNGLRTKVNSRLLTPAYAPLEQYGEEVSLTPATDLYALGATMYEALTGSKPNNALDRAKGVTLNPIGALNPNVSEGFSDIINQMLEMRLEKRFSSAGKVLEFLVALDLNSNLLRLAASMKPTTSVTPTVSNRNSRTHVPLNSLPTGYVSPNSQSSSINSTSQNSIPQEITIKPYLSSKIRVFIALFLSFLVFNYIYFWQLIHKEFNFFAFVFSNGWFLILMFGFYSIINDFILQNHSRSFIPTSGTIVKSEIGLYNDKKASIEYIYTVNKVLYRSNQKSYIDNDFSLSYLTSHPLNFSVIVYFDPTNPSQSVLFRKYEDGEINSTSSIVMLILGLPFLGFGLFSFLLKTTGF